MGAQSSRDVEPFETRAPEADLVDMRTRLAAPRLPEVETVLGAAPGRERWAQGVPLADLAAVVEHWKTNDDWRWF